MSTDELTGAALERLLARPVYVVGVWADGINPDRPPSDTIVAHSTADALATWLRRNDPGNRSAIRRLALTASRDDQRWTAEGEPAVASLRQRRATGDGRDRVTVAVINEL